ncbi:hypothetical protein Tco_0246570 [Tanacetum coccineum]
MHAVKYAAEKQPLPSPKLTGYGPTKKTGKAKTSKKGKVIGSHSIGKNLKVNEMLYRKLAEQKEKRKAEEETKVAEDEQKRKADEEAAATTKAEEESAISKAAKEKAKAAEENSKQKTTKRRIKEAKGVSVKKISETENNEEIAEKDVQENADAAPKSKEEFLAKLEAMKKAAEEEAKSAEEQSRKLAD